MSSYDLCFEALSALSGCEVKPISEFQEKNLGQPTLDPLTPQEFLNRALLLLLSREDDVSQLRQQVSTLSIEKPPSVSQLMRKELFVNEQEFFDPYFDYDFTHTKDEQTKFERGNEPYKRPCGWNRIALNVWGKYPDGNGWLEMGANAWPVSYHGTSIEGAKGIIRGHYKPGGGQAYGRGIYSSPNIHTARKYSKKFTSKKTNKTYEVILQNRINPNKRTRCSEDIWLVSVPEGSSPEDEKEIVESSIRPYGFLLREVPKET